MDKSSIQTRWTEIESALAEQLSQPNYQILKAAIEFKDERKEGESVQIFLEADTSYSKYWFRDKCEPIINVLYPENSTLLEVTIKEQTESTEPSQLSLFENKAPEIASPEPRHPQLKGINPKLGFEEFVVGNNNRFAHAAALAVAQKPAVAYNPLFIYGSVGVGKTHLLHAIALKIKELHPDLNTKIVTSEKFTQDLIFALKDKRTETFKDKYRKTDILLIDDIQFLAGKEATQEEFFHTFNELYSCNKQIILTSDRPPKDIPTLQERLKTRFAWGLIADIQPPELETRIAILRKKLEGQAVHISDEVLSFIASQIPDNVRVLEGALTKISAYAALMDTEISLAIASKVIQDMIGVQQERPLTIGTIKRKVADYFSIDESELASKSRTKDLAYSRQICMYLIRELTNASLPKIGENFGNRDHSTVMYACDKVKSLMDTDPETKQVVNQLLISIKEG